MHTWKKDDWKKNERISHEQKLNLIGGTSGTSGYEGSDSYK